MITITLLTFVFTGIMAMAGLGAAFILVPIFLAVGIEVHTAMATALLLNTISTSISTVTFVRKKLVVWKIALPLMVLAVTLSPVGVLYSNTLDKQILILMFASFLILASLLILFYKPKPRVGGSLRSQLAFGSIVGSLAGFLGGLLGVGGGSIIVPALVGSGLEPRRASATASFVVIFASFSGFLAHANLSGMDTELLLTTGIASALGAGVGAWLASEKIKAGHLKAIIAVILLATAAKMLFGVMFVS